MRVGGLCSVTKENFKKDLMCAIRDLCTKELVLLFSSEVVLECDWEEGEGFKG